MFELELLEKNGRRWYSKNGIYMPSVTTVLSEFLTDFTKVDPDVLARAAAFGKAVHDATALEDAGRLDWDKLDPNLAPCVKAWNICKDKHNIIFEKIEGAIYSKKYRYAGRFDRICLVNEARSIVEIKTRKFNPIYDALQTSAYMQGVNEMCPNAKVCHRYVCELKFGDESEPQFYEVKGHDHFNIFLSALALFRWKNKNF